MKTSHSTITRLFALMVMVSGLLAGVSTVSAQSNEWDPAGFPDSVQFEQVYGGLNAPVGFVDPGDGSGRQFIVQQSGTILIAQDGAVLDTPFLDISDLVSGQSEQGLLGLAFAPDFAESGNFYVDYTDLDGNTVIAQYTASDPAANEADRDSALTILTQLQPYPNHNGGQIVFGPGGDLYIGFGDGGGQGDPDLNGQNLQTWLGKILRIDVSNASPDQAYAIPEDNPYADGADGLPEIFISGVRNPWRFSFDSETGDLYIGDVGQSDWEEVDYLPAGEQAGADLGWSVMEASHCYRDADCDTDGLVLPIFEVSHSSGQGCSITGGSVIRGDSLPGLNGVYLFADYCTGLLWATARDDNGDWQTSDPIETGLNPSSFGTGPNGEIYIVDLNGAIYQLIPA